MAYWHYLARRPCLIYIMTDPLQFYLISCQPNIGMVPKQLFQCFDLYTIFFGPRCLKVWGLVVSKDLLIQAFEHVCRHCEQGCSRTEQQKTMAVDLMRAEEE